MSLLNPYIQRHTVKNAVITCMAGFILFSSLTVVGKTHDKKISDEMYSFPYACILQQDTGYQGYRPGNATVIQPVKKPRAKELTGECRKIRDCYIFRVNNLEVFL